MTPSWYDLLGVAPDASPDEIRAAWKASIADLDPTDRRFRVLNEAAEVLLDPARRAEYDGSLVEPVETTSASVPKPLGEEEVSRRQWLSRRRSGPVDTTAAHAGESLAPRTGSAPPTARRGIPSWLLVGLAALTAVMIGLATWLYAQPSDAAVRDATSDAQGAAERAVLTILAYDYRTLEEDQTAAGALMTPDYRKEYDKLFAVIKENAPGTKTAVTVDAVVASGVVRSGEERVQVLVFLNRLRTNAEQREPDVFRDQVTLTMQKVGEDWLVDDMRTEPPPA